MIGIFSNSGIALISRAAVRPSITGIPVGHTLSDGTNSVTITADDQEIDLATWDVENLKYRAPANVFTTGASGNDGHTLTLSLLHKDTKGAQVDSVEKDISFKVIIRAVNDAPVAKIASVEKSLLDGAAADVIMDLKDKFSDIDNSSLSFSLASGAPSWLSVDAATCKLSVVGQVPANASQGGPNSDGKYTVTVRAFDGQYYADIDVEITVTNVAPTAVTTEAKISLKDADAQTTTLLNGAALFTDGDGDTLSYSVTSGPSWLQIDAETGAITLNGSVPKDASQGGTNGTYTLTVKADDDEGGTVEKDISITVANLPPKVSGSIVDMRILKETSVSIDGAQFTDPDDDRLTYSATGLPAGLEIDPTTGEISGQILGSVAGELVHEITVTVDDGLDTASFTFKITPFDLPVIQPPNPITLPPAGGGEVDGGTEPDGNTVLNEAVREMSGSEDTKQVDMTSNSPVIESVEAFDSLASNDVQSDLPIKRMIESELANLKSREFVNSDSLFATNDQGFSPFTTDDANEIFALNLGLGDFREYAFASTQGAELKVVDTATRFGVRISDAGTVLVDHTVTSPFTLTVEIDVQGDITVRDVQLDPSTGQIVELNRVARGAQFFETLSWLSQ